MPSISKVRFGLSKKRTSANFFMIKGTGFSVGDTVDIVSQGSASRTWRGIVIDQLGANWFRVRVNYTGARSPIRAVETVDVTVTSGGTTSAPQSGSADVYQED